MRTPDVFRAVLRNRELRRVELAFAGFNTTETAAWLAILVYAYHRGGTTEASLAAVLQLVPAAVLAPFLGVLADRHPALRVLAGGYLAQAAGLIVTALAITAHAPAAVVYAGAVVVSIVLTGSRPAQAVVVPGLARTPEELTATNVVSSWCESAGALAGGAICGVLLELSGVAAVVGLTGLIALGSALLVRRVEGLGAVDDGVGELAPADAFGGFTALAEHGHLRVLMAFLMGEYVLYGAMDILFVVLAIDVLDLGEGWAGYLNAAFAIGGILGGTGAAVLVGRRRLAPPIALGLLVWSTAFVVIAIWPAAAVAGVLLAAGGAGRVLLNLGCYTLLQRSTPSELLGRVFGVLEGLSMAGLALGALVLPPLVALGGSRAALLGAGLLLPLLLAVLGRPLVRIDRRARVPLVEIALLRSMTIFGALPAPALEGVARALEPLRVPAGTVVIRMGDEGDRFYAIADGEAEVTRHGAVLARLGRGDGFGEIALLEEVPRTATVTAATDLLLYALEKVPFVTAVTGHAPAAPAQPAASALEIRPATSSQA
jgi:MFS family permease